MQKIWHQITEHLIPVFRRRLSGVDALPQLAVLGLLSGLFTGGVILVFRLAIEWPLEHFLPGEGSESFEELDLLTRGLLPLAGALGLGLLMHRLATHDRKVGIVHVMERLNYHQGYISMRSALVQFISGVATVVSGQSAGREGAGSAPGCRLLEPDGTMDAPAKQQHPDARGLRLCGGHFSVVQHADLRGYFRHGSGDDGIHHCGFHANHSGGG